MIGVFWPVRQESHRLSIRSFSWVPYCVCQERKFLWFWKNHFSLLNCYSIIDVSVSYLPSNYHYCTFLFITSHFIIFWSEGDWYWCTSVTYFGVQSSNLFKTIEPVKKLKAVVHCAQHFLFIVCFKSLALLSRHRFLCTVFHWKSKTLSTRCWVSVQNLFSKRTQGFSGYSDWRMALARTVFVRQYFSAIFFF